MQQVIDVSQGTATPGSPWARCVGCLCPATFRPHPRSSAGFNPLANNGYLLLRKGDAWLRTLKPLQLRQDP